MNARSISLSLGAVVLTGVAWLSPPAFAQDRAVLGSVTKTLAAAEASLTSLESQVGEIERTKALPTSDALDATLTRYLGELKAAFASTLGEAEQEAKAGKSGAKAAAARIAAWERLIPRQRERMEKVVGRLNALDATIQTAEGDGDLAERLASWFQPAASCVPCQRARLLPQESTSLGALLADLVEPEAEAAIAATCVVTCTANPAVCGACLIAAVGTTAFVSTKLDEAFAACDRRPTKAGRAVCKAAMVLAYITIIA